MTKGKTQTTHWPCPTCGEGGCKFAVNTHVCPDKAKPAMTKKTCKWKRVTIRFWQEREHYKTGCGANYSTQKPVKDGQLSFCPFCGGKITEG